MSTKEQLKGDSLRRQLKKTDAYVEAAGLELDGRFDDYGVSAFRGRNAAYGALARFRDAVSKGEIAKGSHLIIESMDRLSRQKATDAVAILTEIINGGVVVVTLDDGQKYSEETLATSQYQLFVAIGAMVRAHEESRRKSGLLADTWKQKRIDLRESRKVLTSRVPEWLKLSRDRQRIEIVEDRVAIVREIFDLACRGYGMYSIASLLNERREAAWGSPKRTQVRSSSARSKGVWRESYLKKILTNRAVLGEFQPHRIETDRDGRRVRLPEGDVLTDYYPPIVSPAVFADAQRGMEQRRVSGRGRKGRTFANLLTGVLFCSSCGSTMRYLDKGKPPRGGKYLRCSRSLAKGGCIPTQYKYAAVEQVVLSALETFDASQAIGGKSAARRAAEIDQSLGIIEIDAEAIDRKVERLNTALQLDAGDLPLTTLAVIRKLESDKYRLDQEVHRLRMERDAIFTCDPEQRRAAVRDLAEKIAGEADEARRSDMRRAISSEIHRLVESIVIRADRKLVHEISDVDLSWMKNYRPGTQSRLERHLDIFGFEVSIKYRNGGQHLVNGLDGATLKMKWSRKFSDLRLVSALQGREEG
jgi:hypothetical protein